MDFDNIPISCAIIKVEKIDNNSKQKGEIKDGPRIKVDYTDVPKTVEFLKFTLKELEMSNYAVYLSGFEIIARSSVWTKRQMVEALKNELNNENIKKENMYAGKTR